VQWFTVYDLRSDTDRIDRVQHATLTTSEFGLKPEPALFGSEACWHAIDDGTLPVVRLEGRIANVYWGSMGDWPEFTCVRLTARGGHGHDLGITPATSWGCRCASGTSFNIAKTHRHPCRALTEVRVQCCGSISRWPSGVAHTKT
jgi:hypothetical protein